MEKTLMTGLSTLGLPQAAAPQLLEFAGRLLEKNQVMNLTAITEPEAVAKLHLLDCAALLAKFPLRGKAVVDVGTGAGFPGMVLRILEARGVAGRNLPRDGAWSRGVRPCPSRGVRCPA